MEVLQGLAKSSKNTFSKMYGAVSKGNAGTIDRPKKKPVVYRRSDKRKVSQGETKLAIGFMVFCIFQIHSHQVKKSLGASKYHEWWFVSKSCIRMHL